MTQDKRDSQLVIRVGDIDRENLGVITRATGLNASEAIRQLIGLGALHIVSQKTAAATIPALEGKPITLNIQPKADFDKIGRILHHIGTILAERRRVDLYVELIATLSGREFDIKEFKRELEEMEKELEATAVEETTP